MMRVGDIGGGGEELNPWKKTKDEKRGHRNKGRATTAAPSPLFVVIQDIHHTLAYTRY